MGLTTNELAPKTGRPATLWVEDGTLHVDVLILDSKVSYGQTRYLVTPLSGSGEKWVDAGRVSDVQATQATQVKR